MRTVPRTKAEQLSFFRTHLAKWAENAEQLGFTPEMIAQFAAKVAEAEATYAAQGRAEDAARSATLRSNIAQGRMLNTGAGMIGQIRSRARMEGRAVYSLGSISPPDKPSPIAPPGQPQSFKADLDAIGCLTITWTCKNPRGSSGTTYQLWRRVDPAGKFEFLGITGEKKFVDATVPRGAAEIVYKVQALRSTATGVSNTFNVHLAGPGPQFAALDRRNRLAA